MKFDNEHIMCFLFFPVQSEILDILPRRPWKPWHHFQWQCLFQNKAAGRPKMVGWTVKHLSEWICMLCLFTMSSSERTCHPQMIEAMSTSHSAPLGSVKINTFLSVIYPIAASLGYGLYSSYFLSPIPPDPGRFPTSAPAISCGRLPPQLALQARTPGRDGPCRDVGNDSGISWKL